MLPTLWFCFSFVPDIVILFRFCSNYCDFVSVVFSILGFCFELCSKYYDFAWIVFQILWFCFSFVPNIVILLELCSKYCDFAWVVLQILWFCFSLFQILWFCLSCAPNIVILYINVFFWLFPQISWFCFTYTYLYKNDVRVNSYQILYLIHEILFTCRNNSK